MCCASVILFSKNIDKMSQELKLPHSSPKFYDPIPRLTLTREKSVQSSNIIWRIKMQTDCLDSEKNQKEVVINAEETETTTSTEKNSCQNDDKKPKMTTKSTSITIDKLSNFKFEPNDPSEKFNQQKTVQCKLCEEIYDIYVIESHLVNIHTVDLSIVPSFYSQVIPENLSYFKTEIKEES